MAIEIVVIGSNVDRERSIGRILRALLDLSETVHVSRIVETLAVGLLDGGSAFLNLAAALEWKTETVALKARLIEIEIALGRDRCDRCCSQKSRTADIDPVLRLDTATRRVAADALPAELYARSVVVDVLTHLGVEVGESPTLPFQAVEIPWGCTRLGRSPTTLTRRVEEGGA